MVRTNQKHKKRKQRLLTSTDLISIQLFRTHVSLRCDVTSVRGDLKGLAPPIVTVRPPLSLTSARSPGQTRAPLPLSSELAASPSGPDRIRSL